MQEQLLSPRQLASAIGASESSLKRWADEGLLRASRTAGGHRRIALTEAVRFIRERRAPILRPEILGLHASGDDQPEDEASDLLFRALVADDRTAVQSLILAPFARGESVAAICDARIRPALARIGELWKHDDRGILVEHRATDNCLQAIVRLRGLLPMPPAGSPVAVGGSPTGDSYILPSLMAATTLAEVGFRDSNLGPDVPERTWLQALRNPPPRLVWVASSTDLHAAETRRLIETLRAHCARCGASLVIGGRGVATLHLGESEGLHRLANMSELVGFARGLLAL